ncbi:MAG: hypothetical protein EBQ96_01185 [Proteobacteria bacterium]|nr:hypothetical protein [Pseudomonadota bacterium]
MRRPLVAVFDNDMLVGTSPMERMLDRFGWQSNAMPPYVQWCIDPYFTFRNADDIAAAMGFGEIPSKRVERYPSRALINGETGRQQHPTWFLQWGWAMKPNKQLLIELGDATFFASLHFIKEMPGNNGTLWHLDHIELFNRSSVPLVLPCGSKGQVNLARELLVCVADTIANLNADNWEEAEKRFHRAMDDIIRTLDGNPRVTENPQCGGTAMRRRYG